jgi:hypothetical protein
MKRAFAGSGSDASVDVRAPPGHDQVPMAASTDRGWDKAGRGRILGALVAVSGALASGCGSAVSSGLVDASSGADGGDATAAHGSSDDGALPACTWPASLDDAAPRPCSAARAYVTCQYPGGAGSDCMSNDPTTCPGAPGASCTDLCHADEYAVGCGGIGPAPSPPIPAGCRSLPSGPGGGTTGCCPCGGTGGSVGDGGAVNRDAGVSDAGYEPCNDGACGPTFVCEYPIADGCYAKGICVPQRGCGGAGKQPTYCGCDGGGVLGTCDLRGYVTGPVQSLFAIDGGGSWSAACVPCGAGGPCACSDAGPWCPDLPSP